MIDRAIEYAKSVIDGKQVAGQLVIKACQRFLDDLKRQEDDDFLFITLRRTLTR